jgi:queuine tRNA-ribosyltransferase
MVESWSDKTTKKINSSTKALGDYAIIEKNDSHYIIQKSSLEIMHPSVSPDIEARTLYVVMTGLAERLAESSDDQESAIVVWDVGLGAAFNAMAVIREREALSPSGTDPLIKLHIVSFENDLDSLRLSLEQKGLFPHLNHPAPECILRDRKWENKEKNITWEVVEGDFFVTMAGAPKADFVLYDLFSPRSNVANWGAALFSKLFGCTNNGCVFVTYSRATAVKSALLAAGFHVGSLPGIPPKEEHVIAWNGLPKGEASKQLLSKKFLVRWRVSHKRFPCDIATPEEIGTFSSKIESHEQWEQE